ncbi:programmed cell death protein 6-like [Ornithodoros turicata]|uniref:programmed cell death protein 6-like n=1 Tax=Ornithodoros turicata TaxID=34597 RepID=UPI0031396242
MAGMAPPVDRVQLQQLFQSVDKNNSGAIGVTELQNALSNGTWKPFNPTTVRTMIGMFDHNHTGNVTFDEFMSLWNYITEWLNCFRRFDADNSGNIDRNELFQALAQFGFNISQQTLNNLMIKYDSDKKGSINFDDFIQCCVTLQGATQSFRQLDRYNSGRITLTFEEFLNTVLRLSA